MNTSDTPTWTSLRMHYKNPVIRGDWSDPGVVRVDGDYYSVRLTKAGGEIYRLAPDGLFVDGEPVAKVAGAEEAYATMQRADKLLSPQARTSWRWRHLYLRALLDAELKANGGTPDDACYEAFAELIDIYHAHDAEPHVRPPLPKAWRTDSQTARTKGSR